MDYVAGVRICTNVKFLRHNSILSSSKGSNFQMKFFRKIACSRSPASSSRRKSRLVTSLVLMKSDSCHNQTMRTRVIHGPTQFFYWKSFSVRIPGDCTATVVAGSTVVAIMSTGNQCSGEVQKSKDGWKWLGNVVLERDLPMKIRWPLYRLQFLIL